MLTNTKINYHFNKYNTFLKVYKIRYIHKRLQRVDFALSKYFLDFLKDFLFYFHFFHIFGSNIKLILSVFVNVIISLKSSSKILKYNNMYICMYIKTNKFCLVFSCANILSNYK